MLERLIKMKTEIYLVKLSQDGHQEFVKGRAVV
jgi:hypothetical protein